MYWLALWALLREVSPAFISPVASSHEVLATMLGTTAMGSHRSILGRLIPGGLFGGKTNDGDEKAPRKSVEETLEHTKTTY